MIDLARSYPDNKFNLEQETLKGVLFEDVKTVSNPITGIQYYPITAYSDGISIHIDKYRCYVGCIMKQIHNSYSTSKKSKEMNLKFSELEEIMEHLFNMDINIDSNKISKLHLSFVLPMNLDIEKLIKTRIFLHKSKYYNHNKMPANNGGTMKEFVYTNFTIGFYSVKEKKAFLKIGLKLNKSAEFKKLGISKCSDLMDKQKIKHLFRLFMKRFNEIIIVDDFKEVKEENKNVLMQYMNYRFWDSINSTKSKQTKSRHLKKFKLLIQQHNLNNSKLEIKIKLHKAFKDFIEN